MASQQASLIDLENVYRKVLDGGAEAFRVSSNADHGVDMTIWWTRMKPGETHDWHDHQEDEVIYVIDGEGRYELKERTIEYKKDDFIFMPKKTMHKNITTGTKDVLLVAIFNPATE